MTSLTANEQFEPLGFFLRELDDRGNDHALSWEVAGQPSSGGFPHAEKSGSQFRDFQAIWDLGIKAADVAEPLVTFDWQEDAQKVANILKARKFDVVGVQKDGLLFGIAYRDQLSSGPLGRFVQKIPGNARVSSEAPISSVFSIIAQQSWGLVSTRTHVWGIVTSADLFKPPARLWLFGLTTLVEQRLLEAIRFIYPGDTWLHEEYLPTQRLENARLLFEKRKQWEEETDLTDCLQLCDKARILIFTQRFSFHPVFSSKRAALKFFHSVERLRNRVAHVTSEQHHASADLCRDIPLIARFLTEIAWGQSPA